MILYNAAINTMKEEKFIGYVIIENAKIAEVAKGSPNGICSSDIDCRKADLYPGFIDIHTHLGIIENALGFEGDDCNEQTDPVTPQLRAEDAINPMDECFAEARSAGITSVCVSPGSANAVCGSIAAVKTAGRRIDDMIIKTVGMKFALGENPKTVYNDKDDAPSTRMATAALIREVLYKAKKYSEDLAYSETDSDSEPPEFDLKLRSLCPLMRKEIKAHFHCHRSDDIFTAIRIAKEFDLDYVLIHATEGHLVADILGEEKVSATVGPIICDRSKPELKNLSPRNAGELYKNNVKTALCTDHPVIPVQYLPMSAAVAVKGGLPFDEALKAITINAAEIAGINDRVGSLEIGKDADLVLFKGNPLDVMNSPELVMIDGDIKINNIKK